MLLRRMLQIGSQTLHYGQTRSPGREYTHRLRTCFILRLPLGGFTGVIYFKCAHKLWLGDYFSCIFIIGTIIEFYQDQFYFLNIDGNDAKCGIVWCILSLLNISTGSGLPTLLCTKSPSTRNPFSFSILAVCSLSQEGSTPSSLPGTRWVSKAREAASGSSLSLT